MPLRIERATLEDLQAIASVTVKSWQTTFQDILPISFLSSLTVESQLQRHQKIFTSSGVFITSPSMWMRLWDSPQADQTAIVRSMCPANFMVCTC